MFKVVKTVKEGLPAPDEITLYYDYEVNVNAGSMVELGTETYHIAVIDFKSPPPWCNTMTGRSTTITLKRLRKVK